MSFYRCGQPEIMFASEILSPNPSTSEVNSNTFNELLEQYKFDPELLKVILISKAEQDKLRTEEVKHKTEMVKLEVTRLEYAMLILQNNSDNNSSGLSRSSSLPSQSSSRQHVMEAIRNKVRSNTLAKQAKALEENFANPLQQPIVNHELFSPELLVDCNLNIDWDTFSSMNGFPMNQS